MIDGNVSVKTIRDALPSMSRERSTLQGFAYFAVSAVAYLVLLIAIAWAEHWVTRVLVAVACGLSVAILFVVGHDACHGSLTPSTVVNGWLGRIAFLPSLHPYAAWEYSHNALHHGFTNLRGKDPVYCPMTVEEYRATPRWRQRLERVYRSVPGLLPLYLAEIWWKLEIAPSAEHRKHIRKRGSYGFDRAIVLAYSPALAILLGIVARTQGATVSDALGIALIATTIPFLTFAWLIGFATFQHHTHPRVLWYANVDEWNFYRSQLQGTVHVVFPQWIERLLHNIMEHTAHHVDTKVPLYHLTGAQRQLEMAFGDEVITESFSLAGLRRTFRTCRLYDYARHQWLDFDGMPTTEARPFDA